MKLKHILQNNRKSRSCLLATNFYNYETLEGILLAAAAAGQPIILQLTKSSLDYMGIPVAVSMARAALQKHGVEGWLHLDHSDSYELVKKCLDAGFDSVMIDASEKPFEENAAVTRQVVELAQQYDANVEAELGYVAKLGQSKDKLGFTDPGEAARFVRETGVNALAVAIGSAHGFYTDTPRLDLELLSRINEAAEIPLVLHGGSGIPGDTLQESIRRGICKINLATEIKNIFMNTLQHQLAGNDEIDLRKVFPPATAAVAELVEEKLAIIHKDLYSASDYPKLKKYDVHTHVNTYDGRFIEISKKDNFRLLSINLDAPGFPPLEKQQEITTVHAADHTGDFFHACSFRIDDWGKQNRESDIIDYLKYAISEGAIAVKVWKNIGMELKDENGNFVMIDHPGFKPIIEFIIKQGIPLIGHLGEPRNCWLPLEEMTVSSDRNYFSEHPEYHMYLHPEFPSYEDQISSRDRLLEAYPELTFVGAHLASLEWSVDELSLRLDKYPNMVVDTAERICHLQHQAVTDRQKVYDFFIKYQDRIMYGTDIVDDGTKSADRLAEDVSAIRKRHWMFFTSPEEMTAPKVTGSFHGLGLPRTVVDKLYFLNAERIFLSR